MDYSKYLYNIKELIDNTENMVAHINKDEGLIDETLIEHSNLVFEKALLFNKNNNFLKQVKLLINDIIEDVAKSNKAIKIVNKEKISEYLLKAFLNAIYLHDIGKSSIAFQYAVMANEKFEIDYNDDMSENHAPFSTRIYLDCIYNELQTLGECDLNTVLVIAYIGLSFAYSIQKHHSGLDSLVDYINSLDNFFMKKNSEGNKMVFKGAEEYPELKFYKIKTNSCKIILSIKSQIENIHKLVQPVSRHMYLLNRILYSVLVTADTVATSEYMSGTEIELKKLNIDEVMGAYRDSSIYKNIQEHFKSNIFKDTINEVRCDIFKESDGNLVNNIDKNIFYLESPTGSGKTNTSVNIAFRCIELTKDKDIPLQRIVYTAPFTAITTQTADFLNKLFQGKNVTDVVELNCHTPIKKEMIDEKIHYELSLLDHQMLNYPITLISHVRLFSTLFGPTRSDSHSLIHMFNSVVIIDEVQAYNVGVWAKMIDLIDIYAKYMNIKFIIMSATLPKIGLLLNQNKRQSNYADLIEDSSKYFENKYFKNRISKYNFDMISEEMLKKKQELLADKESGKTAYRDIIFEKIRDKIYDIYKNNSEAKILVEFITKRSCREFFNYIKDEHKNNPLKSGDLKIREITSDDSTYLKKKVISESKNLESIIVVSTQCIEAGVDINMDFGFKDISYIDNEEQFLGRIRREYDDSKYSEAIFFDLDDADSIYGRNQINFKNGLNLLNDEYRTILQNKKFSSMFKDILDIIIQYNNTSNEKVSNANFRLYVEKLNYSKVYSELELIAKNKNEYILYFPFKINVLREDKTIALDGREVWSNYKSAFFEKDYAKRKIKISEAISDTECFTYKYRFNGDKADFEGLLTSKDICFEHIGDIYYINADKKIIDKLIDKDFKFNKEKFEEYRGNCIL